MANMTPEQIFQSKSFQFGLKNIPNFAKDIELAAQMGTPLSYDTIVDIRKKVIQDKWRLRKERYVPYLAATDVKKQIEGPHRQQPKEQNAYQRHLYVEQTSKTEVKQKPKPRIDQKAIRETAKKASDKAAYKVNDIATKASNTTRKIMTNASAGKIMANVWQNKTKWARRGALGFGTLLAFNMIGKAVRGYSPEPAIPREYERKYDIMKETLTDFGSPLKLHKTTSMVLKSQKSTVRKATHTTCRSVIESNISLFSHSKAIGHTRY